MGGGWYGLAVPGFELQSDCKEDDDDYNNNNNDNNLQQEEELVNRMDYYCIKKHTITEQNKCMYFS